MTQDTQQILENHFKPGNVVYSFYRRSYDLVHAFDYLSTPYGFSWVVTVQACDKTATLLLARLSVLTLPIQTLYVGIR